MQTHEGDVRQVPGSSELALLWGELTSGRTRIVSTGSTEECHYFEFAQSPVLSTATIDASRLELLERVLLGNPPKAVALEMGCSQTSVTTHIIACLRAFGLKCTGKCVPALLVWLLHALRGRTRSLDGRVERLELEGRELRRLSRARPDLCLASKLSESECEVIRLFIDGHSYAAIASRRRTSKRTVANQIASVYKKLGVSGRIGLLCYLFSEAAIAGPPRRRLSFGDKSRNLSLAFSHA